GIFRSVGSSKQLVGVFYPFDLFANDPQALLRFFPNSQTIRRSCGRLGQNPNDNFGSGYAPIHYSVSEMLGRSRSSSLPVELDVTGRSRDDTSGSGLSVGRRRRRLWPSLSIRA